MLSNLLLVTESFTLIAGNNNSLFLAIRINLWTPVVVSSEHPIMFFTIVWNFLGCFGMQSLSICKMIFSSLFEAFSGSGRVLSFWYWTSYLYPSWMRNVRSLPSSTIRSGPFPSPQLRVWKVHHQYSSKVSPFQAKTLAAFDLAIAAAAWSWVEKMLQLAHRISAPNSCKVSIRTAVWMVIWRLPLILAPLNGFESLYSFLISINPGISTSASSISRRPQSAKLISLTL